MCRQRNRWWRGRQPLWWTHSTHFIDLGFPPEMLIGFEPRPKKLIGFQIAHRFSMPIRVHVCSEAMASMNGKNQSNQLQPTIIPLEKRRAWCHYQASRQVSTIQGKKVTEWTMYVLMKDGANPVCEPVLNANGEITTQTVTPHR